jgi:5-methylcytosine-specific restriction endonuclease McrA
MAYKGYPFASADEATKRAVWNKGEPIKDFDQTIWRRDTCGATMKYSEHGMEGTHGWEIDHIYPRAKGGNSDLNNLQPLQWQNNRKKGDTYPWSCR